jgi:hypothetical protein
MMRDPRWPEHCPECLADEGGCAEKPCEVEEEHQVCGPHAAEGRAMQQEWENDARRGR